jgi:hypothetical protein
MDSNRKPRHNIRGHAEEGGRGRTRIKWEKHMRKLTRKKGKALQEVTRTGKRSGSDAT